MKDRGRRQFLICLGIWGIKRGSMGYNSHTECHPGFCLRHLPPTRYFGFAMKRTFGALSTSTSFTLLPETAFACQILIALSEDNYSSFTTLPALWAVSSQIQLSVQFLMSASEKNPQKNSQPIPQPGIIHKYLQLFSCLGVLFKNALLRSLIFIRSTTLSLLS